MHPCMCTNSAMLSGNPQAPGQSSWIRPHLRPYRNSYHAWVGLRLMWKRLRLRPRRSQTPSFPTVAVIASDSIDLRCYSNRRLRPSWTPPPWTGPGAECTPIATDSI
jgi:hypothetical protein